MTSFFPSNATTRRLLYELLHLWSGLKGVSNFNVGFAPVDPAILAEPMFSREPYQIQLYAELMTFGGSVHALPAAPHILEVGAAAGGGLRFIRRHLDRPVVYGVDNALIASIVARLKGVRVYAAAADQLPFAAATLDCVLCVDSFSIFPRIEFLKETRRVLKHDGRLLIGDYLQVKYDQILNDLTSQATATGFTVEACSDATSGVLRSLEADHDRKARFIAHFPASVRQLLSETMSLRGSERYARWQSGDMTYYMAVLRPASPVGNGKP